MNSNIFLLILFLFYLLLIPIYPNSSTLDFGGNVDVSLVYLVILILTDLNKTKVFYGAVILIFYSFFSDFYGLIEILAKLLTIYLFVFYIEKFLWKNLKNDAFLILTFFIIFYFISFIIYKVGFDINFYEYISFIIIPLLFNFFISVILLIIIKYTSWPALKDQI